MFVNQLPGLVFRIIQCLMVFNRLVKGDDLIFANQKDLRMIHLDSSRPDPSLLVDNLGDATALDFYYKERIIFWTDLASEKILGIRLNAKSRKPFEVVDSGLSSPDGLAVDWLTKKVYWVDSDTKRIEVCQFDGENRKVLFMKDIDAPRAIALVPQEGLLFWSDWGDNPKIERASMDGKHRKVLINDDLRWPNGLAIDHESRRLFWVDGKLKYISSVDYDGNNRNKLMSHLPHSFGLAIFKDNLYITDWTNMGVSSCNRLSETCKLLLPNLRHQSNQLYPMGIKVYSPSMQPHNATGCDNNNGGCSHLCLLSSEPPGYSCACPTGVLLTRDNRTCASGEEKFLVLLRKTDIRKISLDTEDHNDVVLLYSKDIKHAIGVDYDPIEGRIYWTDDDAKVIRRANINSTQYENVILSANLNHPDGIAVDWVARNLYWTDAGTNAIRVSRLDGSWIKTLISTDLDEPRAIVVDPWKALMFWTDWGSKHPKIEKASLDGSSRKEIISQDIIWPNGIAIDLEGERIFWGDAKIDRIETCDYDGGSRKILLERVAHPFGLTILDDYVYWTDWHERAILRTNKRIGGEREIIVDLLPDMMGLKAISIHQDLGLDNDLACYKDNGGCSQLCLDRHQTRYTCGCADGFDLDYDERTCKRSKITTPAGSTEPKTKKTTNGSKKPCTDRSCFYGSSNYPMPSPDSGDPSISAPLSPSAPNLSSHPYSPASSSPTFPSTSSIISFPLIGVFSALVVFFLLILYACRNGDKQQVIKQQPQTIPLMQQNHLNPHPSVSEVRIDTSSPYPPTAAIMPTSQPPPDLLLSYSALDSSRCETTSHSGIESVVRMYPIVPPPSPVSCVSRSNGSDVWWKTQEAQPRD